MVIYTDKTQRIIVPESIEKEFLVNAHRILTHPGITRFAKTISSAFLIQGLYGKIKLLNSGCLNCQRNKNSNQKYGELKGYIAAKKPFEKICLDLLGPVSVSEYSTNDNADQIMILVIVDVFTKWTQIFPLKRISSKEILKRLDSEWIKKWGKPKELLSDQGTQFVSHEFSEYLRSKGIRHIISSTYNPTGNSVVERVNQVIGNSLRCLKGSKLLTAIKSINFSLQSSHHQTLNATPYEIVFQKNPFNPFIQSTQNFKQIQSRKRKQALKDLALRNKGRLKHKYERFQMVFIKNPNPAKMDSRWSGPFKIVKVCSSKNYVIIRTPDGYSRVIFRD